MESTISMRRHWGPWTRTTARIALVMAFAVVVVGSCRQSEAAGFADVYCAKPTSAGTARHGVRPNAGLTPLTVTVFNFAQVGAAGLTSAESIVNEIFRSAGVAVVWLDACQANGSIGLRVNILPTGRPVGQIGDVTELGFADCGGVTASVLYRSVIDMSLRYRMLPNYVLALVMAHELGHVLLGPGAHSSAGIMKPVIDPRPGNATPILFSSSQGAAIRRSLEAPGKPSAF